LVRLEPKRNKKPRRMSWNIYFQVIFLSSELIFPFVRSKVREEVSVKVKELFGLEIGDFFHVSVSVRFKRIDGIWLDDTVRILGGNSRYRRSSGTAWDEGHHKFFQSWDGPFEREADAKIY